MDNGISRLVAALPTRWIENFVAAFEAGRVQRHPQARFVNARGECCIVGALAGVNSGNELICSQLWSRFLGSPLEELSRRFEARRLDGHDFYVEALLVLAARRVGEVREPALAV